MARHLVTGATGFFGTALILELLDRYKRDHIHAVVRAVPGWNPADRAQRHLTNATWEYGRPDLAHDVRTRVTVMEADLTQPALHRRLVFTHRIDTIWHTAGSPPWGAETGRPHVTATLHMLNLADLIRPDRFMYISSAYINTDTRAIAHELAHKPDTTPRDDYITGKLDSERDALGTHRFQVIVLRPSTLIGHSTTSAAITTADQPAYHRAALDVRDRFQQADIGSDPIDVDADPDALVNALHIDHAARQAVTIAHTIRAQPVYHLTPDKPLAMSTVADRLQLAAGLPRLVLKPGAPVMSAAQSAAQRALSVWRPVPAVADRFDRSGALAATGARDSVHAYGLECCLRWATRESEANQAVRASLF
jgi:nucleoside-diphosphate-sugar epimerase